MANQEVGVEQLIKYSAVKEKCPKCGLAEETLEIGLYMTACYTCSNNSLSEQRARAHAYEKMAQEREGQIQCLERERKIDQLEPDEIRKELDLYRARMSVIGMDGVSCYTGYDSTTISLGMGKARTVARTNILQAVDELAEEIWGPEWVKNILEDINLGWKEDLSAAPGMNAWYGPSEGRWDEEKGKFQNILPEESQKDDLKFLGASGPVTDEYYAEGEEESEL